jgi:hypothetical protein
MNILSAMSAARNIAKDIENPQELDDGTLEMILFLTQKAISDLKELHQRNIYSSPPVEEITPEQKIKQVRALASNAYELIGTLE